ncbi:hypothetical protein HZC00_02725 [Candidatus Kaiserbacteria bacterium]|nr:hypothetical protein [Candidatus Kaiserbacteria bacterium]
MTKKTLDQDFFKNWAPTMAYVLGFFAADGTMIKNKREGHFIEFHITDRKLLFDIRRAVSSNHKIAIRVRNPKWKLGYRLQIGSKRWFSDLQRLGFSSRKSNVMLFPNVPDEFLGSFIRGYFDGDGCVYFKNLKFADRKKARWILMSVFTSGSRQFLMQLHTALKRHGVQGGSIRNKKSGYDLSLSHKDSLALYRLMYDTVSDTSIMLPRKYRLFTKAINTLYPLRP